MEEKAEKETAEINWSMFDIVSTLGSGAFGQVYKVKCLTSTRIGESGQERVYLSRKSIKATKVAMNRSSTASKAMPNQGRSLLADSFYVIKIIDVENVPQEIGVEAL